MDQQEQIFVYKEVSLHYSLTGKGKKVLLAFHGYGQNKLHFRHIGRQLSEQYTMYAFDLFFHGKSTWPFKDKPLTKKFLAGIITSFLEKEKINQFSLMGFSMGGKLVLSLLEQFPHRVEQLILIAPDGIKTSFWYSLATNPGWAKQYFRKVVISPYAFKKLALTFRRLRLVDKGIVRFAEQQMDTRQKRLRVYYSWMVFRELKFSMSHIASLINTHQIPTTMFLGVHDRIVTKKNMGLLLNKLHTHELIMLETGHNHLLEAVAAYYAKLYSLLDSDK